MIRTTPTMTRYLAIVVLLVSMLTPWVLVPGPAAASYAGPSGSECCVTPAPESPGTCPESGPATKAPSDDACCPDACDDCGLTCCHRVLGTMPTLAVAPTLRACPHALTGPGLEPPAPSARRIDHPPRI